MDTEDRETAGMLMDRMELVAIRVVADVTAARKGYALHFACFLVHGFVPRRRAPLGCFHYGARRWRASARRRSTPLELHRHSINSFLSSKSGPHDRVFSCGGKPATDNFSHRNRLEAHLALVFQKGGAVI